MLSARLVFGICAATIAAAAVLVASRMSGGRRMVGALAVLVLFASWSLCIWLTPLGPRVWLASSLAFLVVGLFLGLSLAASRGVRVVDAEPDVPPPLGPSKINTVVARRAMLLVLLLLAVPAVAHLAALGRVPS